MLSSGGRFKQGLDERTVVLAALFLVKYPAHARAGTTRYEGRSDELRGDVQEPTYWHHILAPHYWHQYFDGTVNHHQYLSFNQEIISTTNPSVAAHHQSRDEFERY